MLLLDNLSTLLKTLVFVPFLDDLRYFPLPIPFPHSLLQLEEEGEDSVVLRSLDIGDTSVNIEH